jgi:hypothetical protein
MYIPRDTGALQLSKREEPLRKKEGVPQFNKLRCGNLVLRNRCGLRLLLRNSAMT